MKTIKNFDDFNEGIHGNYDNQELANIVREAGYHDLADSIESGKDVFGKQASEERYKQWIEEAKTIKKEVAEEEDKDPAGGRGLHSHE